MRKILISHLLVFLAACGVAESKVIQSHPQLRSLLTDPEKAKRESQLKIANEAEKNLSREFTISLEGLSLTARVDELNHATILNYPNEWRGKAKLVRYDGGLVENETPFSENFCKKVRDSIKNGIGSIFVRTFSYRASITFDIPAFLNTNSFLNFAQDVAKSSGIFLAYPAIKNVLDERSGYIELNVGDDAISKNVGEFDILKDELNFNIHDVKYTSLLRRRILINAGDLICDLISGEVTISMVYSIVGENRTVKLTCDPLLVELQ